MTRNELESLNLLMALNVQLASTEIILGEIPTDAIPDEVRDGVAAYKRRVKELNEKIHDCIFVKFESLLTEEE